MKYSGPTHIKLIGKAASLKVNIVLSIGTGIIIPNLFIKTPKTHAITSGFLHILTTIEYKLSLLLFMYTLRKITLIMFVKTIMYAIIIATIAKLLAPKIATDEPINI